MSHALAHPGGEMDIGHSLVDHLRDAAARARRFAEAAKPHDSDFAVLGGWDAWLIEALEAIPSRLRSDLGQGSRNGTCVVSLELRKASTLAVRPNVDALCTFPEKNTISIRTPHCSSRGERSFYQ
jgi:hypothetical protein